MILAFLLGSACAADPPPVPELLHVSDADLVADDGSHVLAATATMAPDGKGEGQDVTATEPGAPPLQIQAPQSDWDLKAHIAHFQGGVTAVRGPVTLTCDHLTVTFAGTDRVHTALAEGGVHVLQGQRHAEGDKAELTADTGEIVLTGHPQLSEGVNRMSGDRITLWLDDEKVRCEHCQLLVAGDAIKPK